MTLQAVLTLRPQAEPALGRKASDGAGQGAGSEHGQYSDQHSNSHIKSLARQTGAVG